ncbi:MAG: hypothetical protein JW969_16295 [Spirochaetales bacterium]|nr:hypothetical protein [Spirochaetales bacterium]
MRQLIIMVVMLFAGFTAYCHNEYESDCNNDGIPDQWIAAGANYNSYSVSTDRNYDGKVDMIVDFSLDGKTLEEEFDFNYDGLMDTFNYFERGEQVRQEIDSNYDQKIDIWIFLIDGIYIEHYEQDTNFDGKVDKIKKYGLK